MKIIAISDIHNLCDKIELPDGDILVCAGDLTSGGTTLEISMVNSWFGEIKRKYKHGILTIAGNHDWLFERQNSLAKSLITNATYLQDEEIVIDGIKFYGSPWQPRFFDWAFNKNRGPDIKKYWDNIPQDTDVLITHGPPHTIGDTTSRGISAGCEELLDAVMRINPKVHIFGHIHEGYGVYKKEELTTKFVNASICTLKYSPFNKPIEINL